MQLQAQPDSSARPTRAASRAEQADRRAASEREAELEERIRQLELERARRDAPPAGRLADERPAAQQQRWEPEGQ